MTTTSGRGEVFEFADLEVRQQPDDVTCGPTCLQALYAFHGEPRSLDEVIASVRSLTHGGTLGVLLGIDALERGYDATLYSYNLNVLDPSWFAEPGRDLKAELGRQMEVREGKKLRGAIQAYIDFLDAGGDLRHEALTPDLLAGFVLEGSPVITGLSATYLYGCQREVFDGTSSRYDDELGEPVGHFVVISGYDPATGDFRISDPSQDNPLHGSGTYWVKPHRLIGAIFLGVTTYDGNLLVVRSPEA